MCVNPNQVIVTVPTTLHCSHTNLHNMVCNEATLLCVCDLRMTIKHTHGFYAVTRKRTELSLIVLSAYRLQCICTMYMYMYMYRVCTVTTVHVRI